MRCVSITGFTKFIQFKSERLLLSLFVICRIIPRATLRTSNDNFFIHNYTYIHDNSLTNLSCRKLSVNKTIDSMFTGIYFTIRLLNTVQAYVSLSAAHYQSTSHADSALLISPDRIVHQDTATRPFFPSRSAIHSS